MFQLFNKELPQGMATVQNPTSFRSRACMEPFRSGLLWGNVAPLTLFLVADPPRWTTQYRSSPKGGGGGYQILNVSNIFLVCM